MTIDSTSVSYVPVLHPCNFLYCCILKKSEYCVCDIEFEFEIENIFKWKKFTKPFDMIFDFIFAIYSTVRYDWNKWISMFFIRSYWKSFFFCTIKRRDLSTAHVNVPTTQIRDSFIRNILCVWTNRCLVFLLWNSIIFGVGIIITMLLHRKFCQTKSSRFEEAGFKFNLSEVCEKTFLMDF